MEKIYFWTHIPLMFAAYAVFTAAFVLGLVYLFQEMQLKSHKPSKMVFRLPPLDDLDQYIFRLICWGFPILTVGLILGAGWAHIAWGRYWSWTPKETWSFITWLVYFLYLYIRFVVRWRGRKTAYLSLLGYAIVIFTYMGVNHFTEIHDLLYRGGH